MSGGIRTAYFTDEKPTDMPGCTSSLIEILCNMSITPDPQGEPHDPDIHPAEQSSQHAALPPSVTLPSP